MQHSPFWKASSRSPNQKIIIFNGTQTFTVVLKKTAQNIMQLDNKTVLDVYFEHSVK